MKGRSAVAVLNDKNPKRHAHQRDIGPDLIGLQPIEPVPPVHHQLRAGDGDGEHQEPAPIQIGRGPRARIVHPQPDGQKRRGAHRQDQDEHEPPVIRLRQIPAERGRDRGSDHDGDAKDTLRKSAPLRRIDGDDDRLRQWHQWRPEGPLPNPVDQQRDQRIRRRAQQGTGRKTDDRPDDDVPMPPTRHHPAGCRGDHRRRDDVQRHDPGHLLRRRGQCPLQLGQHDIDDRCRYGVEHRAQRNREQNEPARNRFALRCSHAPCSR